MYHNTVLMPDFETNISLCSMEFDVKDFGASCPAELYLGDTGAARHCLNEHNKSKFVAGNTRITKVYLDFYLNHNGWSNVFEVNDQLL